MALWKIDRMGIQKFKTSLEVFIEKEMERGKIEFSIRAFVGSKGHIFFTIHSDGDDGNTADFGIKGNELERMA